MHRNLLQQFAEHMEKQEILSRMTESQKLHGYSYSEIHTLDAIGRLPSPNTTSIANELKVTRGAVSKITKKLLAEQLIESYQEKNNRQKIFYRLTNKGHILFNEHTKRHTAWLKRDELFLHRYSEEELTTVMSFMTEFNKYLESCIKELGGTHDDD